MANALGIFLFALGIGLTVALHEAGHMVTARAFGMRVRRFFVGFGPTVASFRKGNTEYGFAALPLGGFCDIAGMTSLDDTLTPEEERHAMYKKPWWQRIIVLLGGIMVNLLLGFVILFVVAQTAGIPNPNADVRARVAEVTCSADQRADGALEACDGLGPAGRAGIQPGDVIVALNGELVTDFADLRNKVIELPGDEVTLTIERGGHQRDVMVELDAVTRYGNSGEAFEAGSIGLVSEPVNTVEKHNFFGAIPATWNYTVYMLDATVEGLKAFPAKIPGVVASIFGAERDVEGPMSVVGASLVGGELVERSLWDMFFMMLATLNFFLALFNLIPLPPFDGGHIAVVIYEKIRDGLRALIGKEPLGAADYTKLMPLTYVIWGSLFVVGFLIIIADVVNPIRLFG